MSQTPEPSSQGADELFARARGGDQDAWSKLFETCYPKVIRVIRRKLHSTQIRSLYDSTDFASDVLKSLAANAQRLDFPTMDSLMGFLVRVAEHKLADEYRRQTALKRDRGREESSYGDYPSGDPTPSAVAIADEYREQFLHHPDEQLREIVRLRYLGYGNDEIASRLNLHVRKVQRELKRLEDSSPTSGA